MDIFDLLGNLSIALITVDIAVYAVGVSLFGSQLRKNLLYLTRKLSKTEKDIETIKKSSLPSRNRIMEMEKRIKEYKEEERNLTGREFCLSVKGAVFLPCLLFAIALISVIIHPYLITSYEDYLIIAGIASLFMFLGIYRLICTLQSIDFASKNKPLPDFDVYFHNEEKRVIIDAGKKQSLVICLENKGFDVGELIDFSIYFPPEFKVHKGNYQIAIQPDAPSVNHPLYSGVIFVTDYLHADIVAPIDITITAPDRKNTYKIPLCVNEKKITEEDFELELIVK